MKGKNRFLLTLVGILLIAGCNNTNNNTTSNNDTTPPGENTTTEVGNTTSNGTTPTPGTTTPSETTTNSTPGISTPGTTTPGITTPTPGGDIPIIPGSTSTGKPVDLENLVFYGVDNVEHPVGKYFNPYKDVSVFSKDGEDLTRYLSVSGNVEYGSLGKYTLTYTLNGNGYNKSLERTVDIVEKSLNNATYSRTYTNGTNNLGNASYRIGNGEELEKPLDPIYLADDLRDKPIPTSSWWTTMLISNYGGSNGIFTNPYRSSFQGNGVEITDVGEGFTQYWTDGESTLSTAQFYNAIKEVLLKANSLNASYYTRVIDYSDSTAKIAMRNTMDGADEMVITFAQGSPFIFAEQKEKTGQISLSVAGTTKPYEYYDLSLKKVEGSHTGDGLIVKIPQMHIGYVCAVPTGPNQTLPQTPIYADRYYLINTPKDTTFTISRKAHSNQAFLDNVTYTLGDGNYFSIGAIQSLQEASFYHKYAYSFIHKSYSDFEVDYTNSKVITTYYQNYSNVEGNGHSIVALMPHQYKYSSVSLTDKKFKTIRGDFKIYDGNIFTTEQSFYGMLPGYTLPTDSSFSKNTLEEYFASLDGNTNTTFGDSDEYRKGPYWDAKTIYPLAQGVMMADQAGSDNYKQKFLTKLENYLIDWFTYSGSNDESYLYYDEVYGTMYYSNNDFNTSKYLNDHHFTHGYLVLSAAIASMYDSNFFNNYKGIIELLAKDYANPSRNSSTYPYLRTFDKWFGHSWADGYGAAAEGNNQESSGEALNSWIGAYTFGLLNNDQEMIDAAIYGYTTELNSIKQYVFNYDQDLWSTEYKKTADVCCIMWGGKNTDATFFGLNPSFVYGIHWLPIGEYVSGYAITDNDKVALQRIYNSYLKKKVGFKDTWMSNMRCVEALLNPDNAIANFNKNAILNDDYPNDLAPTYYNIYAAKSMGLRSDDLYIRNATNVGWDVFKKDGSTYYVQVFNPSSSSQNYEICDELGNVIKMITIEGNTFAKIKVDLKKGGNQQNERII